MISELGREVTINLKNKYEFKKYQFKSNLIKYINIADSDLGSEAKYLLDILGDYVPNLYNFLQDEKGLRIVDFIEITVTDRISAMRAKKIKKLSWALDCFGVECRLFIIDSVSSSSSIASPYFLKIPAHYGDSSFVDLSNCILSKNISFEYDNLSFSTINFEDIITRQAGYYIN